MKQLSQLLAICAFAVVSAGFTANAQASHAMLRIDTKLTHGHAYAASGSNVTLCLRDGSTGQEWCTGATINRVTNKFDVIFTPVRAQDVTGVRIIIHGNDMLIVDQWEIRSANGVALYASSGVDNDVGWCFSTDPGDGQLPTHDPHCLGSTPSWGTWYW